MPIERELKYVLRPTTDVAAQLLRLHREKGWKRHLIEQAYIAPGARIRKRTCFPFGDQPGATGHTFTYKHDLPDFTVVEVESDIPEDDFDNMWSSADTRLVKVRFSKMKAEKGEQWDIDVFLLAPPETTMMALEPYCILAECEMIKGHVLPTKLPGVVNRNLMHYVRPGDKAFASRQIADHEKTTRILKVLAEIADAYYA